MTSDQLHERQLEQNVGQLFERVVSGPALPDADRARTLARLLEQASLHASPRARARQRPWLAWAGLAAALVAAAAFFLLLPVNGSLTWAAVAQHLEQVHTLAAQTTTERLEGTDASVLFRSRLYYKDPGMSRTELYESPDLALSGDPDRIEVLVRTERQATELKLYPEQRRAERTVQTFSDGALDGTTVNLVAVTWARLREVARSTARPIGARSLEGLRVVGFEVPAEALFGSAAPGAPQPKLCVWAERDTGTPVALVLETESERTTVSRIRWNQPLSDDLFSTAGPEGWDVAELAPGLPSEGPTAEARPVSFAIQLLAGAHPLPERYLSNADVATAWVVPQGSTCSIQAQMTAEGTEKLAKLTRAHLGERLAVVIDGRVEMAPTIRSEIADGRVVVTGSMDIDRCREIVAGLAKH